MPGSSSTHDPAAPVGHAHAADLDACLDLINSLELSDGVPEDHIPTVDDAVAYFTSRSLAHEGALRTQAGADPRAWLGRIGTYRAALRDVWDAAVEGRSADAAAIATLNDALGHVATPQLVAGVGEVAVAHRHDSDATAEALARVTRPLVDAIAAGDTDRFRICANDGCRWVFEDTSRGGRRRWCDMRSCGNRDKVRRFRARRRPGDAAGVTDGDAASEG